MLKMLPHLRESVVTFNVFLLALGACSPVDSTDAQKPKIDTPPVAISSQAQAVATAAQWRSSVDSVIYKVSEDKTDENGVTSFSGCLGKPDPKCLLSVSGKRDGFRKVQFLSDPQWVFSELVKSVDGKPSVGGYISLNDCGRPKLVLKPTFQGNRWLFFEQFSLMLDGVVVLEQRLDFGAVDREVDHSSVSEGTHFAVDEKGLQELRRINPSSHVLIRLTGKKGYVAIDTDATKTFTDGIVILLRIYDALDQAIAKVGIVKDEKCPI